jgi:hypothetical protein
VSTTLGAKPHAPDPVRAWVAPSPWGEPGAVICCRYVEAEIEYKRSRFCSEIAWLNSQSEACDNRANSKEITNETGL